MAATLSFRPQANVTIHDREPSFPSVTGSPSSSTFSNPTSHHKLSSQTSLIPQSPLISNHRPSRPASGVHRDAARHRRKRLRSQYPLDSPEPHVEYILVASFDIDRGPIMEHQYPGAISPDENMLAELMLPDQTHVRTQDWTMFFLHKDATVEGELAAEREERKTRKKERKREREQTLRDQGLATDDT